MSSCVSGIVQRGIGDFRKRMESYPEVFERAAGERLFPGTINVNVDRKITIKEDFRVIGKDINEPDQDLLFEKCLINDIPAYRIRPYHLATGEGGHGDDVLEIVAAREIPNIAEGGVVEITFLRDE
jgi:CTP-dependent riboflavin kinase